LTRKTIGNIMIYLEYDLNRTYPHIDLFDQHSQLTNELREVLHMIAVYTKCGYVQGMAYPASVLLLVM
jgi:hypothetical protein